MMPGVSFMRPTSKELDIRWMLRAGRASKRNWAQAMLLSEEFGKTITDISRYLLDYRQCMYWAGGDAEIAMGTAAFLHHSKEPLQFEGVQGA
jgi:hypothetical protein